MGKTGRRETATTSHGRREDWKRLPYFGVELFGREHLAAVAAKGQDKGLLQPAVTKYVFTYYCKGKTAYPDDVDEEEGKGDAHVPMALQILCSPSLQKACRIFAHYY
jgi:hypothetical protein